MLNNKQWPFISVCIVSYNRLWYLKKTIESFIKTCTYPQLEYIIVDNNSEQEVVDYINTLEFLDKKIFNKENMGIGYAMNQARKCARGSYYFNLENDWFFFYRSNWMERAILMFEKDEMGEFINKRPHNLPLGLVKFKLGAGISNFTNNPSLMSSKAFRDVGEFHQYGRDYKYISEDVHKIETDYIKRFKEKYACTRSETPCSLHIGGSSTNPNYGNRWKRNYDELDKILTDKWKYGKWLLTHQYMRLGNIWKIQRALKRYKKLEQSREQNCLNR